MWLVTSDAVWQRKTVTISYSWGRSGKKQVPATELSLSSSSPLFLVLSILFCNCLTQEGAVQMGRKCPHATWDHAIPFQALILSKYERFILKTAKYTSYSKLDPYSKKTATSLHFRTYAKSTGCPQLWSHSVYSSGIYAYIFPASTRPKSIEIVCASGRAVVYASAAFRVQMPDQNKMRLHCSNLYKLNWAQLRGNASDCIIRQEVLATTDIVLRLWKTEYSV